MKRQCFLPTLSGLPFFCLPESIGHYDNDPNHSVNRKAGTWNNYSIHLITAGRGYVTANGTVHTLSEGDAFFYMPLQEQKYGSSADDPWNVRWVHFYGPSLHDFFIQHGFHHTPVYTLQSWTGLVPAFEELLREAEQNKILHLPRLSVLTYRILADFLAQAVPLTSGKGVPGAERIEQLLPLMQREAGRPFILEEWAEKAGVTPYYFCKLFRKVTQRTPLEFMTLCRMQMAKELLLERPLRTIREIAAMAGYPSASYFNKRFMLQEGMTPTEFRRLHERKEG
jgi:AraC-like DNA-binding protein